MLTLICLVTCAFSEFPHYMCSSYITSPSEAETNAHSLCLTFFLL